MESKTRRIASSREKNSLVGRCRNLNLLGHFEKEFSKNSNIERRLVKNTLIRLT